MLEEKSQFWTLSRSSSSCSASPTGSLVSSVALGSLVTALNIFAVWAAKRFSGQKWKCSQNQKQPHSAVCVEQVHPDGLLCAPGSNRGRVQRTALESCSHSYQLLQLPLRPRSNKLKTNYVGCFFTDHICRCPFVMDFYSSFARRTASRS